MKGYECCQMLRLYRVIQEERPIIRKVTVLGPLAYGRCFIMMLKHKI